VKKINLVFVIIFLVSLNLSAYVIITTSGLELIGDIVKAKSGTVYFVDSRDSEKLLIINKEYIVAIYEGETDITNNIMNDDIKGIINYNSYRETITLDNEIIELQSGQSKENIKSPRDYYFSVKTAAEIGELIFSDDHESDSEKANTGISFSAEIIKKYSDKIYFGIGSTFQLERCLDFGYSSSPVGFKHFALYGLLRHNIAYNTKSRVLYLFLNLGYNRISGSLFSDNVKFNGGFYLGLGLGIQLDPILLEVAYKNFGGNLKLEDDGDDYSIDVDYRIISISIGFL